MTTDPTDNQITVWRIDQLEEDIKSVTGEQRKMSDAILMFGVKLEGAILDVAGKFKAFEERRNFWNKIIVGVVIAGVIALVTQLFRIGAFIQAQQMIGR